MKRPFSIGLIVVSILQLSSIAMAGKWDQQWKQVDEAQKKGLPKTAIESWTPSSRGYRG